MSLHRVLQSLLKPAKVHFFPKTEQEWNVVNGTARIGGALHENAVLGLGPRICLLFCKGFLPLTLCKELL